MKILGIDEAGRGPVIGPLIIAGVMVDEGEEYKIDGVKDSKLLAHKKRIELDKKIKDNSEFLIIDVSPKEIDDFILNKKINLNWLEAHKQAEIINELTPDIAIIDCPSPNCIAFEKYLKNLLVNKNVKLVVEHKADVKYPTCSAASIIAKVRREERMHEIQNKYGDTGPGYSSNTITQKFIKENWEIHPEIFRKSWITYKNHEKMKHQKTLF